MAFRGPVREFVKARQKVEDVARGRFVARARELAGETVLRVAVQGWRTGTSPYGDRWTGNRGQPVTLYKTGALFRSLKLIRSPLGFKLSVDGPNFGRHSLATIQGYGGFIRAGLKTLLKIKGRRARNAAKRAGLEGLGMKPMTFRGGPRGWVSKWAIRIRGNPMLPKGSREIPPIWSKALERELGDLGRRHFR